MTIVTAPSALELSGNLTKFLISTTEPFTFILKKGATELLEQIFTPGSSGQVEIDVRDTVEENLSFSLQDTSDPYTQSDLSATFTAEIGATTINFKVVRCGVDNFNDSATNFLTANFLTWQSQTKKVTYYSPEFLTFYAPVACSVKCKAYFADDTTETINLFSAAAGAAYTVPTQYALINSQLVKKLPSYFDVWTENGTGERLSYIQRYIASNQINEDELWLLFENSLGGCDTFRASGMTTFEAEHSHSIAEYDEEKSEYRVDVQRKYKKNTGFLDEYERKWLLDMFPSKAKYIYSGSALRRIVVIDSDVNYTSKEIPSNFDFTWQYTSTKPFLNLIRNQNLPDEIVFDVPDIGDFTLPPRLLDFPHVNLTEGALIPIQSPYSENLGVTTVAELMRYVNDELGEVLAVKLETLSTATKEQGHIAIRTNEAGELYGEFHWIDEII